MTFALYPPEVNSGRMYAGAGSAPLAAAAAAWGKLAAELGSAASRYETAVASVAGQAWTGPAAESMAAAAAPYGEWMHTVSAQAAQVANQAQAALAAYEAAFAGVVPPPVIEANRTMLQSLQATNIFGVNSAAIAANQAQYEEMWAQDAITMDSYTANSAAATQVAPFAEPPQNTNLAAQSTVAGAAAQPAQFTPLANIMNALSARLNQFSATPIGQDFAVWGAFVSANQFLYQGFPFVASGITFMLPPLFNLALPLAGATGGLVSNPRGGIGMGSVLANAYNEGFQSGLPAPSWDGSLNGEKVAAAAGGARPVGGLSVPQSWGGAVSPDAGLAAKTLPMAGSAAAAPTAAPGYAGGMPMGPVGSLVNAPRNGEGRQRPADDRPKVMASQPGESGGSEDVKAPAAAADRERALTPEEREEFEKLRRESEEMEADRDAAALLIREAFRG